MSNGQFGVGGQAAGIPADENVTDYFRTLPGGFYSSYLGGHTGMPPGDVSYDYMWNPTIGGAYGTLFATGINSGQTYVNSLKGGIWSGWVMIYNSNSMPGWGRTYIENMAGVNHEVYFKEGTPAGLYYISGELEATKLPAGDCLIEWAAAKYPGGAFLGELTAYVTYGPFAGVTWKRYLGDAGWSGWIESWTTKNTTVDSNGFIKKSSPVVKLFSNGTSELTSEAEGITTER